MLQFYANVAVLAVLGISLAVSLNLLIGDNGIFSAAQGVFYGIGAYAAALVSLHWTSFFLVSVAAAAVAGGLLGLVFAVPALRVQGDYFVVVSIGFSVIVIAVFSQWTSVTGGDGGLAGIPPATFFGATLVSAWSYLGVGLGILLVSVGLCYFVSRKAPIGRMMRSIRDDQVAAESLGMSPVVVRMISVLIASMLAAASGSVFAYYLEYVDPSSFNLNESVLLVTIVVLGGTRNVWGPVLGGLVLGFGVPSLTLLPLAPSVTGPLEQIFVGVVLILAMIWSPDGLIEVFERLRALFDGGSSAPYESARFASDRGAPEDGRTQQRQGSGELSGHLLERGK